MAIDRTAYNALVDDDGSGTVGTVWNKARIAGVILDPVDAALADHPRLDELDAPIDSTTLNVSTTAHGLQPKLPNDGARFMDGQGNYSPVVVGGLTVTLTDGATPALDAALGTVFRLTAAGDRTIAVPTNPKAGQKIVIQHYASGGARTLALNTGAGGFRFGSDITALTQTASGKTDYVGAIYNAADLRWDVVAYAKGY